MVGKMSSVMWLLCALWARAGAISVETPETISAARGESVTLPCTYRTAATDRQGFIRWDKLLRSHSETVVTWTFQDKDYIHTDLYRTRVSISSNAEQSDASVTISQLTVNDNGTYECSVTLLSDLGGISRSRIRLLVLVPPSTPDCAIEGEAVIGSDIKLTCSSKEGSPAPQYSWKSYNIRNEERPLAFPVTGQTFSLKNISTDMSGYYICFSSNKLETKSCNITLAVRPPSMNVALYAGIAGGVVAALILIGIAVYCCCCRGSDADEDKEDARPHREAYRPPPEQLRELSPDRAEDGGRRPRDEKSSGRESPDHRGR
ncbi:cell surface A33 antigen [Tamandua tetradactyla]|uniref:cell surface A33 antigen n=1 Tax=Tamandua tetradactyla TaxID=48850 RepID=UPI004054957D